MISISFPGFLIVKTKLPFVSAPSCNRAETSVSPRLHSIDPDSDHASAPTVSEPGAAHPTSQKMTSPAITRPGTLSSIGWFFEVPAELETHR